jgi:hypothetical protein
LDNALPARSPWAHPFVPWLGALILAAAAGALALGAFEARGGDRYMAARLAELGRVQASGRPVVLAVGDSYLQYATPAAGAMDQVLAAAAPGRGLRWAAINREDLTIGEVEAALAVAARRPPALLVLQFDPLAEEPPAPGPLDGLLGKERWRALAWFRAWVRGYLMGEGDVFEAELGRMDRRDCSDRAPGLVIHADDVLEATPDSLFSAAPSARAREVLARAAAISRVLVVDVPLPQAADAYAFVARERWLAAARAVPGVQAAPCPVVPTGDETCDGRHYGQDAREIYAAWLATAVAAALDRSSR